MTKIAKTEFKLINRTPKGDASFRCDMFIWTNKFANLVYLQIWFPRGIS